MGEFLEPVNPDRVEKLGKNLWERPRLTVLGALVALIAFATSAYLGGLFGELGRKTVSTPEAEALRAQDLPAEVAESEPRRPSSTGQIVSQTTSSENDGADAMPKRSTVDNSRAGDAPDGAPRNVVQTMIASPNATQIAAENVTINNLSDLPEPPAHGGGTLVPVLDDVDAGWRTQAPRVSARGT